MYKQVFESIYEWLGLYMYKSMNKYMYNQCIY